MRSSSEYPWWYVDDVAALLAMVDAFDRDAVPFDKALLLMFEEHSSTTTFMNQSKLIAGEG